MRAGILEAVVLAVSCFSTHAADSSSKPHDPEPMIEQLKAAERSAGFQPTGNFERSDDRVAAYYRCYFTGKLEIPESYDKLGLREGTKDGCSLDENRYDIFFYPIEAVSSGDVPVTQALAAATPERLATVVPHEDFHAQVRNLPSSIAEAAATLVGFLTGAVVMQKPAPGEAELFLRKAEIVNRYYERLRAVYPSGTRQPRWKRNAAYSQAWSGNASRSSPTRCPLTNVYPPLTMRAWPSTAPTRSTIRCCIGYSWRAGRNCDAPPRPWSTRRKSSGKRRPFGTS